MEIIRLRKTVIKDQEYRLIGFANGLVTAFNTVTRLIKLYRHSDVVLLESLTLRTDKEYKAYIKSVKSK